MEPLQTGQQASGAAGSPKEAGSIATAQGKQAAIPLLDLKREVAELKPQLMQAIEKVLDEAAFIMGSGVKRLEQELAEYLGTKHAITLNSGTDALVIALLAAGIGHGDEVITTRLRFSLRRRRSVA